MPLSRAELASGLLYYTPQSSDLSFSLRVDRGGADLEEHVRVLEAPPVTQAKPAQAPKGAQAASKSRLARIMAAHAAAAAATEGDAPSTPAGAP